MYENEAIYDMLTHFIKITNDLIFLGEPISNDKKRKIIRSFPKSWRDQSNHFERIERFKENGVHDIHK